MAEDYLKNEAFIWEGLIARGEFTVRQVRKDWPKGNVPRMLFAWPSVEILADKGDRLQGMISMGLPAGTNTFQAAVQMAERTKAYALLLVERRGEDIKIILESLHGTRCWTLPVRRHGDVMVVEAPSTSTDQESIGVLWQKGES